MDNYEKEHYSQLCGKTGEIPPGVQRMHKRVADALANIGVYGMSVDVMAIVTALGKMFPPTSGDPVTVNGKPAEFLSTWHGSTVRVKFPGDDKAFRVVEGSKVKYD